MIKKAQLVSLDETDDRRHTKALALYQKVRQTLNKQLESVREHYKTLVGDQVEAIDRDDGTPLRTLSQHERERRIAMQVASAS
jgi:hypothetical protein